MVYDDIDKVLKKAARPLATHEFPDIVMHGTGGDGEIVYLDGREYVGCSESTLGRRLREMRALGRVKAQRRNGKSFVEYSLVAAPVQQELLTCPV